jgi:hypothetical protein
VSTEDRLPYEFTFQVLPQILLSPNVDLVAMAESGRLRTALQQTWASLAERHGHLSQLENDDLTYETREIAGHPSLVVTMPTPRRPPMAYFVAVTPIEPADRRRYLTLEMSWDVVHRRQDTVVGAWSPEEGHLNLGTGPSPTVGAFAAHLTQILA